MALLNTTLDRGEGFIRSDQFPIRRRVYGVPASDTIAEAWLTVKTSKSDADGSALFQKIITSSNVAGTGQIEDTGSNGTAVLRFDVLQADSAALTADTQVFYDMHTRLSTAGNLVTVESGTVIATEEITQDQ